MAGPFRIYVDFDDVLCQTARGLISLLTEMFGKTVAFEDIRSFNLGVSFGLDERELAALMHAGHAPEFLCSLEPVPGAVAGMAHWHARGYELLVVTGRPPATHDASRQWLRAWDIPYTSLVFVNKYDRPYETVEDIEVLDLTQVSELDFDLAVEDAPEMVRFLATETRAHVAVLERPWNKTLPPLPPDSQTRLNRYPDWRRLLERFPLQPSAV